MAANPVEEKKEKEIRNLKDWNDAEDDSEDTVIATYGEFEFTALYSKREDAEYARKRMNAPFPRGNISMYINSMRSESARPWELRFVMRQNLTREQIEFLYHLFRSITADNYNGYSLDETFDFFLPDCGLFDDWNNKAVQDRLFPSTEEKRKWKTVVRAPSERQ